MIKLKNISKVFQSAEQISFDDYSKIVLMSDCHRGDGSWGDNLAKNQNPYFAALTHYYNDGYTYIEIGDGDELWENRRFFNILQAHKDIFQLLTGFFNKNRFYLIFGNHDMVKKNDKFVKNNLYQYYDKRKKRFIPLFENIKIHEGLVLRYKVTGDKILLIHGHQVDCLNNQTWKLSRFLVRYLWRPLELYGVNDPTSTAKNYKKKDEIEKSLTEWVIKEKHMLIAGHTHRPMLPEIGQPLYFNTGSCVHPHSITAIEITHGNIVLVKWSVKTKIDGTLFVRREVLAGPRRLADYFK